MSEVTICTAFFDIGRGDWTPAKGFPHYLERSTEVYLDRFEHLCKLQNEIIIYTSPDLAPRVVERCGRQGRNETNTKIVAMDPQSQFKDVYQGIKDIQANTEFQAMINPSQAKNPEYWNPDYVLVTNLKAHFVNHAVTQHLNKNEMVAWIDFGYCRSEANIPGSKRWTVDFDPKKIHLFSYKDYPPDKQFAEVVSNNDVFILGAKVVAHENNWDKMERLMWTAHDLLHEKNMVDDDQGLWLLSYLMDKESFELHTIPDHQLGHDPFVLFNQFNTTL